MRHLFERPAQAFLFLVLAFLFAGAAGPAIAQEKKVGQISGVDNSKMGAYRALAQQIYADFQKGDIAAAAEMGRVLERVWNIRKEARGRPLFLFSDYGEFAPLAA
jgi:hypothetical protein